MAQFLRPDADTAADTWVADGGGTLFSKIDESAADDADFIYTLTAGVAKIGLGSGTDPVSSVNHVVRYRAAGDGAADIIATLWKTDGTPAAIATWTETAAAQATTLYTHTLSSGEADAITDYTALELWFEAAAGGGIAFRAGSAVETSFATTQSPVITAPAGLADGDVIVIGISTGATASTITTSNGFTIVHDIEHGGDGTVVALIKIAAGEGASWTFTNLFNTTTAGIAAATAWTGVHQTTPQSGTATEVAAASTSTPACTAMTPAVDNSMVIGIFGADPAASPTGTPGTGVAWVERADFVRDGDGHIYIESFLQGTAASLAADMTSTETDTFGCIQLALRPA